MKDYRLPRCRNCGRLLRAQKSIDRGFGGTCAIEWADLWLKEQRPDYLGPRAVKLWTKDEVERLIKKAEKQMAREHRKELKHEGGQDRESYSDTQDRKSYRT